MGFYSDKHIEYMEDCDRSFISPESRLNMRLQDLKSRLEELDDKGSPYRNSYYVLKDDIRYMLPEDIETIQDVESAIEIVNQSMSVEEIQKDKGFENITISERFIITSWANSALPFFK